MLVQNALKSGVTTVGVDVSREGSDKTVFSLFIKDTLIDMLEPDIDRSDSAPISDLIADELILYRNKNGIGYANVWIDAVGNGGGVVDSMRRRGYYVNSFKSGEKTTDLHEDDTPKYDMLRSERYYKRPASRDAEDLEALPVPGRAAPRSTGLHLADSFCWNCWSG